MTTRRRHAAIALATALALMPAAFAGAADLVISPGRVDPPDYPAASTDWTWGKLVATWGPPESCEFSQPCTSNQSDIASYPFRVLVLKNSRIEYVEVSSTAWRTPAGIRRLYPASRLRTAYGSRLEAVVNEHPLVGRGSGMQRIDTTNYIVRSGGNALGFAMASGKVSTIITGGHGKVRKTLAMYGPI